MDIVNNIFSVETHNFLQQALETFRFQYQYNPVYKQWVDLLKVNPAAITRLHDIPFMPVSFFKTHNVYAGTQPPEVIFESSGTTQTINSQHQVKNVQLYLQSCTRGFAYSYGDLSGWCILALLPAYLERRGSSLVAMVEEFIRLSNNQLSGFYLYEHAKLLQTIKVLEKAAQPTLLLGVTFGLLDFAETNPLQLNHTIVMETGGMKGRRKELVREEVHAILKSRFGIAQVHGEYGMTEMLSQAYSFGNGIFTPVPWMRVLVRNEQDPFQLSYTGRGIINVIDLANLYSCSFLATDDAGIVYENGSFEVLGRIDHSDIRGCSLMLSGY